MLDIPHEMVGHLLKYIVCNRQSLIRRDILPLSFNHGLPFLNRFPLSLDIGMVNLMEQVGVVEEVHTLLPVKVQGLESAESMVWLSDAIEYSVCGRRVLRSLDIRLLLPHIFYRPLHLLLCCNLGCLEVQYKWP